MPTTVTIQTAYVKWDAEANGANTGDGLTPATAFDTMDAALADLLGVTTADVDVTRTDDNPVSPQEVIFDVECIGTLAGTDVDNIDINNFALGAGAGSAKIAPAFRVEGSPGVNEEFRIRITNPGANPGDWVQLNRITGAGRKLEIRMAQEWLRTTILADPALRDLLASKRVYYNRVPPAILTSHPGLCILIESGPNRDIQTIGGVRSAADHEMRLIAMAPEDAPGDRLDLAAQRLSEVFEDDQNTTLPDGWMLSCQRHEQIDDPKPDASDQQWQRLGIGVYVVIQQTV